MKEIFNENKTFVFKAFVVLVFGLILVQGFNSDRKDYDEGQNPNVITVTGTAEVSAVPDIANISFNISKEAKTVKEAQALVADIEKNVIASLKANNVAEKDFKTTNASFYPKYEYKYDTRIAPCLGYNCPPQNGTNVIVGYVASESMTVKVRDTDTVGKIIQDLGALEVTDLNGPNFAIDDEDQLKAEARKEAIKEAQAKARVLARDLGIRLGKITSFSENGNYPSPVYYSKATLESADAGAPAELPKGENTVTSEVTITYRIK
ncbi:MAG: SIMPL domain-containing protein [Candidatus Paceibacterota bacterium]